MSRFFQSLDSRLQMSGTAGFDDVAANAVGAQFTEDHPVIVVALDEGSSGPRVNGGENRRDLDPIYRKRQQTGIDKRVNEVTSAVDNASRKDQTAGNTSGGADDGAASR